jgi:hypothetical protein
MEHTVTARPSGYQDWMNIRTRRTPAPDVLMEYSCEENNLENLSQSDYAEAAGERRLIWRE